MRFKHFSDAAFSLSAKGDSCVVSSISVQTKVVIVIRNDHAACLLSKLKVSFISRP